MATQAIHFERVQLFLAQQKGMSKEEIKLLGRWRSDAVDIYINEVPQSTLATDLLTLNSRLLSSPPASPLRAH